MNLYPFVAKIEADGLGVAGSTVFVNMLPSEAELAILLRNPLSGTKINYELPGFYQTEFQVIVRGHDYGAIETLMAQVTALLTITMETQVEDMLFHYCRPKTEPVTYPLSDGNLLEFNVWFDTCFVKTA